MLASPGYRGHPIVPFAPPKKRRAGPPKGRRAGPPKGRRAGPPKKRRAGKHKIDKFKKQ